MRPTFSVLLLCWNHAHYLGQCIGSLAEQTDRDFEIVFLDNHSTDGSFEKASSLFEQYGLKATLIRNAEPHGISRNYNALLAASSGELVCALSTDDWLEPDYVETMLAVAAEDKQAGWYSCGGWRFFEQERLSVPVEQTGCEAGGSVTEKILNGQEPHFFIGCAYRRTALEAVGGWDETLPIEDRDLFLRLSLQFPHHGTTRRLVHYRRTSMTASANVAFMLEGWDLFYAKHGALFGARLISRRAETYRAYAALLIDQGELREAAPLLAKALRLRPMKVASYRTLGYLIRKRASNWRAGGVNQ